MWDLIKEELGEQRKITKNIELKVNGATIQDPKAIADVFNEHYTNIGRHLLSGSPSPKNYEDSINAIKCNNSSMFLTPTTEMEVIDLIKGFGNKKSTSVDDIPELIIKECYPRIANALTYIRNLSLSSGYFADHLNVAKVKLLYKKGCDADIGNCKPVSLISAFSKIIIKKIMHKRLLSFLKNHSIISNKQHGFCKGKSTHTAVAEFTKRVYKSLDEKEIIIGLFLDLSKAFALVDHVILLRKMARLRIQGVALK
jgi:hypothetical protein